MNRITLHAGALLICCVSNTTNLSAGELNTHGGTAPLRYETKLVVSGLARIHATVRNYSPRIVHRPLYGPAVSWRPGGDVARAGAVSTVGCARCDQ